MHGTVCTLCGAPGAAPTTTTFVYADADASVTAAGIPATGCDACGDVAIRGPLALAIEDDARAILRAIREHAPATDAVPA